VKILSGLVVDFDMDLSLPLDGLRGFDLLNNEKEVSVLVSGWIVGTDLDDCLRKGLRAFFCLILGAPALPSSASSFKSDKGLILSSLSIVRFRAGGPSDGVAGIISCQASTSSWSFFALYTCTSSSTDCIHNECVLPLCFRRLL
jgi:hypothetical protein